MAHQKDKYADLLKCLLISSISPIKVTDLHYTKQVKPKYQISIQSCTIELLLNFSSFFLSRILILSCWTLQHFSIFSSWILIQSRSTVKLFFIFSQIFTKSCYMVKHFSMFFICFSCCWTLKHFSKCYQKLLDT